MAHAVHFTCVWCRKLCYLAPVIELKGRKFCKVRCFTNWCRFHEDRQTIENIARRHQQA